MCESRVVVKSGAGEKELVPEAAKILIKKDSLVITDILGNSKVIKKSRIKEIDFLKHRVVLAKDED